MFKHISFSRCSNIVTRYPQYTVTYKGIGPGPTGTVHFGCCSQLALFVAKEYQKQPDLNINSLALFASKFSLLVLSLFKDINKKQYFINVKVRMC